MGQARRSRTRHREKGGGPPGGRRPRLDTRAAGPPELLQIAHELRQGGGGISGVQMWRMTPAQAGSSFEDDEHDEEAFMYSGSSL